MEIKNIKEFEKASKKLQKDTLKIALALLFLIGAALLALIFGQANSKGLLLIFAVVIGGYMAMNIGANDVSNNVGPAVGSKAISMGGAILIAAICEMLGAIIAGGKWFLRLRAVSFRLNLLMMRTFSSMSCWLACSVGRCGCM